MPDRCGFGAVWGWGGAGAAGRCLVARKASRTAEPAAHRMSVASGARTWEPWK